MLSRAIQWRYWGLILLAAFGFEWGLSTLLGGPLKTPDSDAMILFSSNLAGYFGGWRPIGTSMLLYLATHLGLSLKAWTVWVAALRLSLVGLLFFPFAAPIRVLAALVALADPSWIMIDATFWSETPFLATLFGIALALKLKEGKLRWALVAALLLLADEIRHVGIFMVPAAALAMGYRSSSRGFRWKRAGSALLVFLSLWMGLNLAKSGAPFSPTREKFQCLAGIISLNNFPYCSWNSELKICEFDSDRKTINNPVYLSYERLQSLNYDPQSPFVKYRDKYGLDFTCGEYRRIVHSVLRNDPDGLALSLIRRVWAQFGPWEVTEQGKPVSAPSLDRAGERLDSMLRGWNSFQFFYYLLLMFSAVVVLRPSLRTEVGLFLILGGFSHALGIALSNPFPALRYMAVHKVMISVGVLYAWASRSRPTCARE